MEKDQVDEWNHAVDLIEEGVLKSYSELRQLAHEQKCYHELMEIREQVLEHLKTLRK